MTPSPQKMTAEYRAQKICNKSKLGWKGADAWFYRLVIDSISQAASQARQEGFQSGLAKQLEIQQIRERQAFEQARELAIKRFLPDVHIKGAENETINICTVISILRNLRPPREGA